MPLNRIFSKIRSFIEPPSTAFNPTWKAYRILIGGVIFLCGSFWSNYDTYRHGSPKKIAIENVSSLPNKTISLDGNWIEVSQKSELLLTPQSYWQQLMFDLDPHSDDIFSFSFTLFFFVVTLGLFVLLKNTSRDFKFSQNTLASLNKFHFLIYAMVIVKVLMVFQFNSYIQGLIGSEIRLKRSFSTNLETLYFFGLFSALLITIINFFKQGIVLQQEQDLTV